MGLNIRASTSYYYFTAPYFIASTDPQGVQYSTVRTSASAISLWSVLCTCACVLGTHVTVKTQCHPAEEEDLQWWFSVHYGGSTHPPHIHEVCRPTPARWINMQYYSYGAECALPNHALGDSAPQEPGQIVAYHPPPRVHASWGTFIPVFNKIICVCGTERSLLNHPGVSRTAPIGVTRGTRYTLQHPVHMYSP